MFAESENVPPVGTPVMVPATGVPDVPGGTLIVTEVSAWLVEVKVKV